MTPVIRCFDMNVIVDFDINPTCGHIELPKKWPPF